MPCDFKQFAITLYDDRKANLDEATVRTCISRLYYFLYHKVLNWLEGQWGQAINAMGGTSHKRLQDCLEVLAEDNSDNDFNKLAMKLRSLHSKRCQADYKLQIAHQPRHIDSMLREVEQADQLIDQLMNKIDVAKQA